MTFGCQLIKPLNGCRAAAGPSARAFGRLQDRELPEQSSGLQRSRGRCTPSKSTRFSERSEAVCFGKTNGLSKCSELVSKHALSSATCSRVRAPGQCPQPLPAGEQNPAEPLLASPSLCPSSRPASGSICANPTLFSPPSGSDSLSAEVHFVLALLCRNAESSCCCLIPSRPTPSHHAAPPPQQEHVLAVPSKPERAPAFAAPV